MTNPIILPVLALSLTTPLSVASAQSLPSIPGASSIMKGVPNLSSISPGNAAGVLGYCVKNKVLGGNSATSTLGSLMKKPGITSASGYAAGQSGNIVTGNNQKFSLNQVPAEMKSQACNAVLKQAPKFL
jgi:hypothetical protein